jgi:hypothetical protein
MTHGPEWKVETNCLRLIIAAGALITCLPALTARAASELSRDQIVVAMGGHRHIRRRKMSHSGSPERAATPLEDHLARGTSFRNR